MDARYSVLKYIADHDSVCPYVDVINMAPDKYTDTFWQLKSCVENGYVSGDMESHSLMRLTPDGHAYLLQLEHDLADKHSEEEKNKAKAHTDCRKQLTYGLIFVIIAWLLDLCTGVFTDLFHKIFG